MKKNKIAGIRQKKQLFPGSFFYAGIMAMLLCLSACRKDTVNNPKGPNNTTGYGKINTDAAFINNYMGLSFQTAWELQQARAATAKYQNIDNAIADGYQDIAVDVENMGHHYLNQSLLNATFDVRHPEILVYNRDEKGKQRLVAVEYAVPLSNPVPEGFTGSSDVWDGNTGFGLWLLHAWVWYKNPDGVFKPFNPMVHLH